MSQPSSNAARVSRSNRPEAFEPAPRARRRRCGDMLDMIQHTNKCRTFASGVGARGGAAPCCCPARDPRAPAPGIFLSRRKGGRDFRTETVHQRRRIRQCSQRTAGVSSVRKYPLDFHGVCPLEAGGGAIGAPSVRDPMAPGGRPRHPRPRSISASGQAYRATFRPFRSGSGNPCPAARCQADHRPPKPADRPAARRPGARP